MRLSLPRRGWRYIFQAPHQENVLSAFFHQTFLFTNILESFEFAIFLSLFFRWLWFSIQLRISQRRIFILSTSDINSSMGILSRRKQKNITNLVSSHWATFKSKVNFVEFDERGSFTIDFCQLELWFRTCSSQTPADPSPGSKVCCFQSWASFDLRWKY